MLCANIHRYIASTNVYRQVVMASFRVRVYIHVTCSSLARHYVKCSHPTCAPQFFIPVRLVDMKADMAMTSGFSRSKVPTLPPDLEGECLALAFLHATYEAAGLIIPRLREYGISRGTTRTPCPWLGRRCVGSPSVPPLPALHHSQCDTSSTGNGHGQSPFPSLVNIPAAWDRHSQLTPPFPLSSFQPLLGGGTPASINV